MKTKKTGLSRLKQLGKIAALTTAALFYACAPKGNSNEPVISVGDNKPIIREEKVLQELFKVYDKDKKALIRSVDVFYSNFGKKNITNQRNLETQNKKMISLYNEKNEKVADLEKISEITNNGNVIREYEIKEFYGEKLLGKETKVFDSKKGLIGKIREEENDLGILEKAGLRQRVRSTTPKSLSGNE